MIVCPIGPDDGITDDMVGAVITKFKVFVNDQTPPLSRPMASS